MGSRVAGGGPRGLAIGIVAAGRPWPGPTCLYTIRNGPAQGLPQWTVPSLHPGAAGSWPRVTPMAVVERVRSLCGFPAWSWRVRGDPSLRRVGRPRFSGSSDAGGDQLLGRVEGLAVADGDLLRDLRQRSRTRRARYADQREVRRASRRDLAVPVLHRRVPGR